MADSLRDALEKLASKWEARQSTPAGFYPEASAHAEGLDGGYEGAADDLRELLAAHPVEPAGVVDVCNHRTGICAVRQNAEPAGVNDEARTSGLLDCGGTGHEFEAEVADCRTCGSVGVSDEAGEGATPVAFRERVAEVLGGELPTGYKFEAYILVDALLAAGVFREPPTREQISAAVRKIVFHEFGTYVGTADRITDAVLNLLGGAK